MVNRERSIHPEQTIKTTFKQLLDKGDVLGVIRLLEAIDQPKRLRFAADPYIKREIGLFIDGLTYLAKITYGRTEFADKKEIILQEIKIIKELLGYQ